MFSDDEQVLYKALVEGESAYFREAARLFRRRVWGQLSAAEQAYWISKYGGQLEAQQKLLGLFRLRYLERDAALKSIANSCRTMLGKYPIPLPGESFIEDFHAELYLHVLRGVRPPMSTR